MIGVLWILAVHRRQHSNRWRRWRTWLAHAVCSCHVPQLQNAPPPPPQHPTSDEGHSWRRRASSQHHGTGIVDGILCILCRCRCVQRRRTPSILRPHARAERALPERLLALTVSSHLLFTQKYAGRFTDIADSRHVKLAGFQFSRLAGFKFFTTSVGKSRKNMLAVSRRLRRFSPHTREPPPRPGPPLCRCAVVRAAPLVVWRLKTSDSRANMFRHQRLTLRNFSSRRKCNSRKPASLKTSNHAQNISVNIRHFSYPLPLPPCQHVPSSATQAPKFFVAPKM